MQPTLLGFRRNGKTICAMLREIKEISTSPEIEDLADKCIYTAKRMTSKLKQYKEKRDMDNPLVSCLTATYGRFSFLREAIACFMEQDYANRELIILNNHPVPLTCDLPGVRILNEPGYPTLGDCRNRLLEEARGEFVRTWDDDDLYLPHAISQGVKTIPAGAPAWKPAHSWSWHKGKPIEIRGNQYEASVTWRTDYVRSVGYKPGSGGDEHRPLLDGLGKYGGMTRTDMKSEASYCYRWGFSPKHISGSLGGADIAVRTKDWMDVNQDTGEGQTLTPADISGHMAEIYKRRDEIFGGVKDGWQVELTEGRHAWQMSRVFEGIEWHKSGGTKHLGLMGAAMICAYDCKTVAEIGLWRGFTSQILGRALTANAGKDGLLIACDSNPNAVKRSQAMIDGLPIQYKSICQDSSAVDWKQVLDGRPLDMAFIDGDHSYKGAMADLNRCAKRLRNGGLLLFHDFSNGHPGAKQALSEFYAAGGWSLLYLPERRDTRDYSSAILQRRP